MVDRLADFSLLSMNMLFIILSVGIAFSQEAEAHGLADIQPLPWVWTFEPWVLACLLASAYGYGKGVLRLWRKAGIGHGVSRSQAACFSFGWLALGVALCSPIDTLSGWLFSAHMLQHEILMIIAAPLIVAGRPLGACAWALPESCRHRLHFATHMRWLRLGWLWLTAPLSAWWLHALALWLWHIPALFQAALRNEGIHVLQHASFFLSALLFWWAVINGMHTAQRGWSMLLVFTTMLHTAALGTLLTLSTAIWYPAYLRPTTALGLDLLEDQQLGGLIMWVPASLAYLLVALFISLRWLLPQPGTDR